MGPVQPASTRKEAITTRKGTLQLKCYVHLLLNPAQLRARWVGENQGHNHHTTPVVALPRAQHWFHGAVCKSVRVHHVARRR